MKKEILRMQMLAGIITEGEYKVKLNEGKQVGDVYHFTTLENLNNMLEKGIIHPNYEGQISTTRNKNVDVTPFMGDTMNEGDSLVRLKLDGNKISYKYKIRPYHYDEDSPPEEREPAYIIKLEFEEQIITNGKDLPIFPYLKEVFITKGNNEIDNEILSKIEKKLNDNNIQYTIN
jgi:hypothetical protein